MKLKGERGKKSSSSKTTHKKKPATLHDEAILDVTCRYARSKVSELHTNRWLATGGNGRLDNHSKKHAPNRFTGWNSIKLLFTAMLTDERTGSPTPCELWRWRTDPDPRNNPVTLQPSRATHSLDSIISLVGKHMTTQLAMMVVMMISENREWVRMYMADRRIELNGSRIHRADEALNRYISSPLFTTTNVWNKHNLFTSGQIPQVVGFCGRYFKHIVRFQNMTLNTLN